MTIPPSKAPLPTFPVEDDSNVRGVGKIRPAKRSTAPAVRGRPATASKSIKSASSAYNAISNKASGNDHVQSDIHSTNSQSREELIEALFDAKKRVVILESNVASLRAENQRCESDVIKQHRRIEKLLDATAPQTNLNNISSKTSSGSGATNEARRELEKSLLVRQLKSQVMTLRSAVAEREIEVEALKKSQKGTKIAELFNEKEEFYLETLRLKQVVIELRESLQSERQKKAWDKKRNGAGEEIRKEVARLTSGYRTILKGIAQPTGPKGSSSSRSKSASVATSNSNPTSKRTGFNSRGRTPSPSMELRNAKLFQNALQPIKTSKRSTDNSWRGSDNDRNDVRCQSARDSSERDELDFFTGVIDIDSEKHFDEGADDDQHQINPFDDAGNELAFETSGMVPIENDTLFKSQEVSDTVALFVSKITSMNLSSVGVANARDKDISVLLSFDDIWDTEIRTLMEDGQNLSLRFSKTDGTHKNMQWHTTLSALREGKLKAVVTEKKVSSSSSYIGEGMAKLEMPLDFSKLNDAFVGASGDVLVNIVLTDRNRMETGRLSVSLHLTSVPPFSYVNAHEKPAPVPRVDIVSNFKVGQVVEGQFKGGSEWYGATVKATYVLEDAAVYDLVYDDGDEEYEMQEGRIREVQVLPPKQVKAEVVVQEERVIETRISPTIETKAEIIVEEVRVIPPPDLIKAKEPSTKIEPVIVKTLKYSVGDSVEALYENGDEWYAANIKAINSKGNYDLLYEDGDVEDDVSEGKIRVPVPPDVVLLPSSTSIVYAGEISAVPMSSTKTNVPICPCGQEMTFGYCSECNARADEIRVAAEAKAEKDAAALLSKGDSSRRVSVKSSEDAFLDNYLDELSDDEGTGLSAGPAVYGNIATPKGSITIKDKSTAGDADDGTGEFKHVGGDDQVNDKVSKDAEDEGDYEEDFDS